MEKFLTRWLRTREKQRQRKKKQLKRMLIFFAASKEVWIEKLGLACTKNTGANFTSNETEQNSVNVLNGLI